MTIMDNLAGNTLDVFLSHLRSALVPDSPL